MSKQRPKSAAGDKPRETHIEIDAQRSNLEVDEGWLFRLSLGSRNRKEPKSLWGKLLWVVRSFMSVLPPVDVTVARGKHIRHDNAEASATLRSQDPELQQKAHCEIEKRLDRCAPTEPDKATGRDPASAEEMVKIVQEIRSELESMRRDGYRIELMPPPEENAEGADGE